MNTKQLIHKAFDVYCMQLYDKTFPYTEANLYMFLEDVYNEYKNQMLINNNEEHIDYDKSCYDLIQTIDRSDDLYEYLTKFIQQHEQKSI